MIKYFKNLQKKIDYFFFKKISSKTCIFNINININKINYFLELKNVKDRKNFLWYGDWDNKKVSLKDYRKYSASYNSVHQIYHEQINYKQSEEYINKVNLILDGKNSGRGQTLKELDEYFISLDNLKLSLKKFGYKSQIELDNSKINDEIGVVIGKNWEIIKLQDKFGGTHRFALCKILDIKEIIVSVKAMHSSLFEKNELKKILSENNEDNFKSYIKKKLLENIN
tara:strand:- start:1331 stop:2008 length:678 start_codon:yes stop_codon:yes gene_type:complete